MQTAAAKRERALESLSLADIVATLHGQCSTMKDELREAQREIAALKKELAGAKPRAMPPADLQSLRRRVAFYCHPDRGGDALLMQSVNTLFDFLDTMQLGRLDGEAGGSVA